jgi:hypothetical protein
MAQGGADVVFRAFLSRRYKSPEVNEYFFQIFADASANHNLLWIGAQSQRVLRSLKV